MLYKTLLQKHLDQDSNVPYFDANCKRHKNCQFT